MGELRTLLNGFRQWSPELDEVQGDLLEAHFAKLRHWMGKMNLTSVTAAEEIALRHYVESMWLGVRIPDWVKTVVDAGSGAGFPGVPVAVLGRDVKVTLIEADRRKAIFLRESTLGFRNLDVSVGRMEEWRGDVDGVVSRGVRIEEVLEFAQAHAKWCGVLTSAEIAGKFSWEGCEELPWDSDHVVAFLNVPRETT
ncbi:MAG: class I SAM-dependent methyltransferase [Acidobacteria bacterium]|nr:class I SAM-dependent methyltransferase [Acidobacteriota bacterium]